MHFLSGQNYQENHFRSTVVHTLLKTENRILHKSLFRLQVTYAVLALHK